MKGLREGRARRVGSDTQELVVGEVLEDFEPSLDARFYLVFPVTCH